tara:strand:+ start:632 stop:1501 length:870 start_codon:yes stop_codon:yes gene_type:complete
MRKIAVIGGSGFIGRNLCEYLSKKNYVLNIDLKKINGIANLKNKIININNEKKLTKAIKNCEYVFHFAGVSDLNKALNNPKKTAESNVIGTINVLNACVNNKVKKVIFSSSLYSFTEEGGFYKSSKLAAEFFIYEFYRKYSLNYTILRFGSIYGKNSNNENKLYQIMSQAIKEKKITFEGLKNSVRKYINVADVAALSAKAINSKYNQKILMITGSKNTKISTLLLKIGKIAKIKRAKIKIINKRLIGHYVKKPKKFVFPKILNLRKNSEIKLDNGLAQLYEYVKKKAL